MMAGAAGGGGSRLLLAFGAAFCAAEKATDTTAKCRINFKRF